MSSKRHLVLWASAAEFPDKTIDENIIELIEVQDTSLALQFLKQHSCAVAILSSQLGKDFFINAKSASTNTIFSLYVENSSAEELTSYVNLDIFSYIFSSANFNTEIDIFLAFAVKENEKRIHRSQLLKESLQQNKQLEALNQDLEKIVDERTAHIEQARLEEEENLSKTRSIIKFIKDIAIVDSYEDLLLLLRNEYKKYHKISDPILLIGHRNTTSLYYFQARQVNKLEHEKILPPVINEMNRHLAEIFQRPFAKTIFFPIALSSGQKAYVCFENFGNENDAQFILQSLTERLQPIAICIDRIHINHQSTETAYRWEKTFDMFLNPISIIDIDYEVIRSNKSFTAQLNEKKCYEQFAARSTPCESCPLSLALEKNAPQQAIIQRGKQTYQVNSYPISTQGDRTVNAVNHYLDITHSRDLYMRLLQSEKMSALGLLAGNIAHELNNPLTGLRSLAQVLMSELNPQMEVYKDLSEIEKAASRSQKIIKNLLDFSSHEQEEVLLVEMDGVVEKTMPMLKTVFRSHRVKMELKAKKYYFKAEPHLIQQVVFNIVNNACQAMKTPGTIFIQTGFDDLKNEVFLKISDTGPGIPLEIQSRIFEPFFTTKGEGQGTGLGLSLVKEIVEKFAGHIILNSTLGQGAAFEIYFPVSKIQNENTSY